MRALNPMGRSSNSACTLTDDDRLAVDRSFFLPEMFTLNGSATMDTAEESEEGAAAAKTAE